MNLTDLASLATIITLVISLLSLSFSARRYMQIAQRELEKHRFETYHKLLKTVSIGGDECGTLKLVSQIAYIHELRNFPEYSELTQTCLKLLRSEWGQREVGRPTKTPLLKAIDDTVSYLEANKRT
jgi:hypothetical protein